MTLNKYKIGKFVEPVSIKCGIEHCENVSGINIDKQFMPSRNVGEDTSKYLVVPPKCFAFNLMHVGRDERIPVTINDSYDDVIVSPAYFVFRVNDEKIILKEYLYIVMNSPEFDRFAWFCTDSSIRGNLEWTRFCEIELDLPDIPVQRKYVEVYHSLQQNILVYQIGLEDLKMVCDAYIDKMKYTLNPRPIGELVGIVDERNSEGKYNEFYGINKDKEFMPTVAKTDGLDETKYKITRKNRFVFSGMQTGRDECIRIGLYERDEPVIISPAYTTFEVLDTNEILPQYLFLLFLNPEMDRYGWFLSDGSIRSNLDWNRFCEIGVRIPMIKIQKDIVAIFQTYRKRKMIVDRLNKMIKSICPILLKGAIEEAKKV